MGGNDFGNSGREEQYFAKRESRRLRRPWTTERRYVDVRTAKREGSIKEPGQQDLYARGGEIIGEVHLKLAWTPTAYGGSRPWFICPGEGGCGERRAAILYSDHSGGLLCRVCLNLAYPSQSENSQDRAKRRAEKARGTEPGVHHV